MALRTVSGFMGVCRANTGAFVVVFLISDAVLAASRIRKGFLI